MEVLMEDAEDEGHTNDEKRRRAESGNCIDVDAAVHRIVAQK